MRALEHALESAGDPDCRALLGPVVPGATLAGGARVPGLCYELDPPQAAFNLAVLLTWRRDARGAGASAHARDCAMATLCAAADWRARRARLLAKSVPTLGEVLAALDSLRGVIAMHAADPDAAAVQGVVRLLGGDAAIAGQALRQLPASSQLEDSAQQSPRRLAWRQGELAAQWLRAALYALRDAMPLEHRWASTPPAPWPGRLPERGAVLLRRCATDESLDAMPFDLWWSYLVDT
jgi:2-methylcitrate dehydratase